MQKALKAERVKLRQKQIKRISNLKVLAQEPELDD